VRELAKESELTIGVDLMKQAFKKGGPLRDSQLTKANRMQRLLCSGVAWSLQESEQSPAGDL